MDVLMDGGWISNLGAVVLSVGWLLVGFAAGWLFGWSVGYKEGEHDEAKSRM